MAGLGPVGRIGIPADFYFEDVQAGSIVGLEEVIQDLALLLRRIVEKQARGSAAATQAAYAIEDAPGTSAIQVDARRDSLRDEWSAAERACGECRARR